MCVGCSVTRAWRRHPESFLSQIAAPRVFAYDGVPTPSGSTSPKLKDATTVSVHDAKVVRPRIEGAVHLYEGVAEKPCRLRNRDCDDGSEARTGGEVVDAERDDFRTLGDGDASKLLRELHCSESMRNGRSRRGRVELGEVLPFSW